MEGGKQTFKVLYWSLLYPGGYATPTGCMLIVKSFLGMAGTVLKTSVSVADLLPARKNKV